MSSVIRTRTPITVAEGVYRTDDCVSGDSYVIALRQRKKGRDGPIAARRLLRICQLRPWDTGGALLATIRLCLCLDLSGIDSKQPRIDHVQVRISRKIGVRVCRRCYQANRCTQRQSPRSMQGRFPCHMRPALDSGVWGRLHLHLATNPGYDGAVYIRL